MERGLDKYLGAQCVVLCHCISLCFFVFVVLVFAFLFASLRFLCFFVLLAWLRLSLVVCSFACLRLPFSSPPPEGGGRRKNLILFIPSLPPTRLPAPHRPLPAPLPPHLHHTSMSPHQARQGGCTHLPCASVACALTLTPMTEQIRTPAREVTVSAKAYRRILCGCVLIKLFFPSSFAFFVLVASAP